MSGRGRQADQNSEAGTPHGGVNSADRVLVALANAIAEEIWREYVAGAVDGDVQAL